MTLDGSNSEACANITIIDDDILEDQEEFMVMLEEDDPRVDVDGDQATVQIIDNDGKNSTQDKKTVCLISCGYTAYSFFFPKISKLKLILIF